MTLPARADGTEPQVRIWPVVAGLPLERAGRMGGCLVGRRVLVVDDVEAMRVLISRVLTAAGYEVDSAVTLAQAYRMSPGSYDAVIVDAGLGPDQGTDLVETLCAADPAAAGRCLLVTGGPTAALPGGIACLTKPFQAGELVAAVRALHQPGTSPVPAGQSAAAPDPGRHAAEAVPPGGNPPAADEPLAWRLLRIFHRIRAHERHGLVDYLHDGPIQELTAATLDLQMLSRSAPLPPALDDVLARISAATASLRWLIDGPWPFMAPETRLASAIQQRTAWLLPAPATIDSDQPAESRAAEVPVIADVVELVLAWTVLGRPPARAHVSVRAEEQRLFIEVALTGAGDGQPVADPPAAQAALDELASALGVSLHTESREQRWSVLIALPRPPSGWEQRQHNSARPSARAPLR